MEEPTSMSTPATGSLVAHPAFTVAPVPRRLFGSFVEHMGRCVYTGIFEPGHPSADADGLREDVLDLVRELGVSTVRYPGGNFVSNYRWEDGVGPVADRPRRLDLAWHTTETNRFGLGEFQKWAGKADVETMLAVNLGTRGTREALDLLEYANHPGGSTWSDLRIEHGDADPYGVRMWCLGNELDGPWQTGHKTAAEYGRLAAETGNAMRQFDPSLELVACGSSNRGMPTFGAWEQEVLRLAYDHVDWISAHAYYEPFDGDVTSFLASGVDMDRFVEAVVATADAIGAERRNDKKILVSFDEWNVWYATAMVRPEHDDWPEHPRLIEDTYSALDAVVVGSLLLSLLRHSDRVQAASMAQLVNVIGPIRTEPGGPAWRQTIFHPFAQAAALAQGTVLDARLAVPTMATDRYGDVPIADAVVCDDGATVTVLAVNRSQDTALDLAVDVTAWDGLEVVDATVLHETDPSLTNTVEAPDRVRPRPLPDAPIGEIVKESLTLPLPPVSWATLTLRRV
jgi:alpha-L-arabinofuranosidase